MRRLYRELGGPEQARKLPLREYQEIQLSIQKEVQIEIGTRIAQRKKAEEDARTPGGR